MRRWNGWGVTHNSEALKPEALTFLREAVGQATPPTDASWDSALAQVAKQPTRLPPHALIDTSDAARLR
ncbi:MAG: hypothetical protein RLZZ369_138, partial [Pseudomonadota bacterium]